MASAAPGADQMSLPGQRERVSISQQVISPLFEEDTEGKVGSVVEWEEKALAMPCMRFDRFSMLVVGIVKGWGRSLERPRLRPVAMPEDMVGDVDVAWPGKAGREVVVYVCC